MASALPDWQTTCFLVKDRGEYLLETGMWSDCRFIVGTEPNQKILKGHKLFLAMASPVFEAMFYGSIPEKDPIAILDVQPEAFKALLEYIYTDKINFTSFDLACELCYGAKKYMLPHLVSECTKFLWSDLCPTNACRAYEFAKLFDEPNLIEKSFQIIVNETDKVLSDSSFNDVDLATILTIFEQDNLNIMSELDLFNALEKYSSRDAQSSGAKVPRLDDIAVDSDEENNVNNCQTIRDALMKIRFLTLTPQQFAEGPAKSNLLNQAEKFAIIMNISSPSTDTPMPAGFSTSRVQRQLVSGVFAPVQPPLPSLSGRHRKPPSVEEQPNDEIQKFYCTRQLIGLTECMNTSVLDCAVSFTCDKNVCVYGIQVQAQVLMDAEQNRRLSKNSYGELLYAHLLDADGSRLTYTHFTNQVAYKSLIDISFNRPILIRKHRVYKVGVVLNKMGWYSIGTYTPYTTCNGVQFNFGMNQSGDSIRDGFIRSIIFSPHLNNNQNTTDHSRQPAMC